LALNCFTKASIIKKTDAENRTSGTMLGRRGTGVSTVRESATIRNQIIGIAENADKK